MDKVDALDLIQCLRKLVLCLLYIAVSTALIRFNKHMMQPEIFPHALALSAVHMIVSTVLCGLLYSVAPSMYPSMETVVGQRLDLMKWFIPIGGCFAIMLYGSNEAYLYCSVALLQFMKEANVMIVVLISCVAGLQRMSRVRMALIIWVITAATVSVSGDLKFSFIGIAFQAVSQLAGCIGMVLGEFLLSDRKLDPLTYTAFTAPACLVVLLVANACSWDPQIVPAALSNWHLLLANACVAFALNVLVATVIKELSAVGFVLTGLTKDIVIVVLSCVTFGEPITQVQSGAFLMTLLGVGMWSLMKVRPDSAPVKLLERALCVPLETDAERGSLLVEKKV